MAVSYVTDPIYQCFGKRWYTRKVDAKRAARQGERSLGRLNVYRCPHCDRWHLGHRPRRR